MAKKTKYSNAGKGDKSRVKDKRNTIRTTIEYSNQRCRTFRYPPQRYSKAKNANQDNKKKLI